MLAPPAPRRQVALAVALASCLALFLAPDVAAQRGAFGPRTTRLSTPQPDLPSLPPGRLVPRQLQRAAGQHPVIVLTGYWPPSNEAVRRFSTDPKHNPQGWIGQDWEGRGYDVHSFFPEFSPPSCSSCGKGTGNLEVDYQDTSTDFWRIVDALDPIAVVTFSRGSLDTSWELEMNQYNRLIWLNDYLFPFQPTPTPPDPGWPTSEVRLSTQPVQAIVDAVNAAQLGAAAFICFSGDGGGFLSEFIAYHGVWYQALHADPQAPDWCVAGGHVHVGGQLSWSVAEAAAAVSLRTLIDYLDSVLEHPCGEPAVYCTPKTTSLGCQPAIEALGWPSLGSGSFQVRATGLHAGMPGLLAWSSAPAAIPFQGGMLCLAAPIVSTPGQTTSGGAGGPACSGTLGFTFTPGYLQAQGFLVGQRVFTQVWSRDLGDLFGFSLTDALAFSWCP